MTKCVTDMGGIYKEKFSFLCKYQTEVQCLGHRKVTQCKAVKVALKFHDINCLTHVTQYLYIYIVVSMF